MRTAVLLAAALAAACSGTSGKRSYEESAQTMQDLSFTETEKGMTLYTLAAPDALIKEEESKAWLSRPQMGFFEDGKLSSRARSLEGEVSLSSHDVTLSTDVVVTSLRDGAVLKTSVLHYSPARALIYADVPVELDRPDSIIHGQGFEATPDLSTFRVLKQRTVMTR